MYFVLIIAGLMAPAGAVWPEPSDIRLQEISRHTIEQEWPFAADAGTLACARSLDMTVVIFIPDQKVSDEKAAAAVDYFDNEYVHVTTDPMQLFFDLGKAAFFTPGLKIEDKIKQLAPFVTLGNKLCDQPKGTVLGSGEL